MSLKQRLLEDANEALKAREAGRRRLSIIRLLRAAVTNAEKDKGAELSEDEVLAVIAREAKRLEQDVDEYARLGQPERVAQLREELTVVRGYLPEQLGEAEIAAAVARAIAETGAAGPKDIGKVMRVLMPQMRGRADGRLVNELVRKALADSRPSG